MAVPVVKAVPSSEHATIKDSCGFAGAVHAKPSAAVLSAVNTAKFDPIGTLAGTLENPLKSPLFVVSALGVAQINPVLSPLAAVKTVPFAPTANRANALEVLDKISPFAFNISPAVLAAFFNVLRNFEPPLIIVYHR